MQHPLSWFDAIAIGAGQWRRRHRCRNGTIPRPDWAERALLTVSDLRNRGGKIALTPGIALLSQRVIAPPHSRLCGIHAMAARSNAVAHGIRPRRIYTMIQRIPGPKHASPTEDQLHRQLDHVLLDAAAARGVKRFAPWPVCDAGFTTLTCIGGAAATFSPRR